MSAIFTKEIKTPIGVMFAAANDHGIYIFDFLHRKMLKKIKQRIITFTGFDFEEGEHPYFELLSSQFNEYFIGTRKEFDLPIQLTGTDFQKRVWQALLEIPYGETRSYKAQSIFLGDEKAIRAVAKANGENCLAIIVPCHRVIAENGNLTGYAGGLRNKEWLLKHEAKYSGKMVQKNLFTEL